MRTCTSSPTKRRACWHTAASSWPATFYDDLVSTVRAFGVERVLFGSDFPYFDPEDSLDYLGGAGLSASELELVTGGVALDSGKWCVRPARLETFVDLVEEGRVDRS